MGEREYLVSTFQTLEKVHVVRASSAKKAREAVIRMTCNQDAPEIIKSDAGQIGEETVVSLSLVRRVK